MAERNDSTNPPAGPSEPEPIAFSNALRLTLREWMGVALFTLLFVVFAPMLWQRVEPVTLEPDHRMPHELSEDYWLWERYTKRADDQCDILLLGDSVIWGEYVNRHETLAHYLNERLGGERCANLGLDGAHPLALEGLVEHYARSVAGKKVVLQCNPLWLSSPQADLQDDKTTSFNHSRLVPQFSPRIPAYHAEVSARIGVVVEEHLPLSSWAGHLQQVYYERSDLPSWTLEHPYDNPVAPLARGLPEPDESRRHDPDRPWYENGIKEQDYPWVDLETSLQWHAFQRVVQVLQRRGNQVFVLVGPFNEHLLSPGSLARYQRVKEAIAAWLEAQQVPHAVPASLPSKLYGDASHPLRKGYEVLAEELLPELSSVFAAESAERKSCSVLSLRSPR